MSAFNTVSGTITALNGEVIINTRGYGSVGIQLSGTWTATVTFQGTVDGTNWVPLETWPITTSTSVTTATANGVFHAPCGGLAQVRAIATAFTSGTVNVNLASTAASSKAIAAGASGGTSSSFNSAFPGTGTAAGFSDGTNMQHARVFDLDSGGGTQYSLGVNLRKTASGGSVEFGTTTDPVVVGGNLVDNAAFTDGTSTVLPAGYIFDETAGTALTENDVAAARLDSKRAQVAVIEDATTRGQRLRVAADGEAYVLRSVNEPLNTDGTAMTIKFARINATASGDNTVVAAVASRKLRVLGYAFTAAAAVSANFQDSAATPAVLAGAFDIAANGGVVYNGGFDAPAFETPVGNGLEMNLSAATNVRGHLTYVEVI